MTLYLGSLTREFLSPAPCLLRLTSCHSPDRGTKWADKKASTIPTANQLLSNPCQSAFSLSHSPLIIYSSHPIISEGHCTRHCLPQTTSGLETCHFRHLHSLPPPNYVHRLHTSLGEYTHSRRLSCGKQVTHPKVSCVDEELVTIYRNFRNRRHDEALPCKPMLRTPATSIKEVMVCVRHLSTTPTEVHYAVKMTHCSCVDNQYDLDSMQSGICEVSAHVEGMTCWRTRNNRSQPSLLKFTNSGSQLAAQATVVWLDYSPTTERGAGSIPDRVAPEFSHVGIVPDDSWPAGFQRDLLFPLPLHPSAAPYSPRLHPHWL
ncbi:hypothetical protein PR048_024357 [Dryococelus australis]|uniref:Uncharacterized protein n=1 Tax=Dryococelus australis TaxID=614101 RepID=A0ABQ9GNF9_9NEOP|nr:hypothetical protein PR048_024357 [Dryococelus australis]